MDKIILDTSIVVKWFINEEGSDKADKWLVKIKNHQVSWISPSILFLELSNGLVLGNKYTNEGAKKAINILYRLNPEIINADQHFIESAIDLMDKYKIAAYDALFIALAEKSDVPLVTADIKHHKKEYSPLIQYLA